MKIATFNINNACPPASFRPRLTTCACFDQSRRHLSEPRLPVVAPPELSKKCVFLHKFGCASCRPPILCATGEASEVIESFVAAAVTVSAIGILAGLANLSPAATNFLAFPVSTAIISSSPSASIRPWFGGGAGQCPKSAPHVPCGRALGRGYR
jgi:hypothetical protein